MRAFHPFTGIAPHIDSGVYMAGGTHVLHGRLLYREAWDHKPPLIHLVNAAALSVGDHTVNSVRSLEMALAGLVAVAVLAALWLGFGNGWAAALGSVLLLLHLYHPNVMRGNQPEAYGAVLALLGVLGAIAAGREDARWPALLAGASGLAFGLASMAKETFALGAVPWFVWLCALTWRDRRALAARAAAFLGAAALPWLAFGGWLLAEGLTGEWLQVVRFNLNYLGFDDKGGPNPGFFVRLWLGLLRGRELVLGVSWVAAALAVAGAAGGLVPAFRRRTRGLPVVLVGFFLACLVGVAQGRRYGYYFAQLVGGHVLLAACGVALLLWLLRKWRLAQAGVALALVVALAAVDRAEVVRFTRGIAQPRATWGADDLAARYIREHSRPDETIWNLVREGGWIHAHADRVAPTRFFYISANLFRDLPDPEGARQEIRAAVASSPPRFVLFDGNRVWLDKVGLWDWFQAGYAPTAIPRLFERRAELLVPGVAQR